MPKPRKAPAAPPPLDPAVAKTYDLLQKVRASKTVQLKPSRYMRATFAALDGTELPFTLRYYQVQGAYHLLALKRMVLGDDTGTGKTIQAISAFAHMVEKNSHARVIIVTPKSTVRQWGREILRFTTGIRPIIVETSSSKKDQGSPLDQRKARYRAWANAPTGPENERVVLILNYALLIRDWNAEGVVPVDAKGKPDPKQPVIPGVLDQAILDACKGESKIVTFFDEAQAFANPKTKTWEISKFLSERSDRAYGLTATLLKNDLLEGFGIYKVIQPTLFRNKTRFIEEFCLTQMQKVPGSQRKIPIVVGYKNLDAFRQRIDPFFLGRKKQDVSDELPVLISKDVLCELSAAEDAKYAQALTGVLELGDGTVKDYEEHKTLVALNYCQQIVNSLSMLRFDEGSEVQGDLDMETADYKSIKVGTLGAKEEALVGLVSDGGELEGERVIVFTRFASLVPRLQKILEARKIQTVAITGKQSDKKRAEAQEAFQDLNSDVKVIFISTAGGVGINLQMARAMVFYELPWTWGDYVQLLGRMIRIGSPHKGVVTYHLMAERPSTRSGKTIDHHVYALLRKKKDLIDKVLGEAAVGALDFGRGDGNIAELLRALQTDARAAA
jgi:SNF2 family DNA or RNA helicase